jgi:hypothetical protein
VVSRSTAFRTFHNGSILPRGVILSDRGLVRGLAAALCGLPALAPGQVNCPAQFGDWLRFAFAADGRPFPPVTVQVIGCRVVRGLGPVRTAQSAAFWQTIAQDLGGLSALPNPNLSNGIRP